MWDLAASLDPRAPSGTLCIRTLVVSMSFSVPLVNRLYWLIHMHNLNRGSSISPSVLLNLLNELRKSYKMRSLPIILLLFRKLNKFNNTGAQILLDSISHITLELL